MAYILTVNVDPAGSGSMLLNPWGSYVSPGKISYATGTAVRIEATSAISLAFFDHWEGDLSGTNPVQTLVMNSDKEVTAVFNVETTQTFRLTTAVAGAGNIAPSSGVYDANSRIVLVATPSEGYEFSSWGGDISGTTPVPGRPNQLQVTMDRNRHITAAFSKVTLPPPPPPEEVPGVEFRNLSVKIS